MARIVHIALKVADLEAATKFYEDLFGFHQTGTEHARGHVSRHMTDGEIDVALMVYDSEAVHEAQLSGAGPCIHHWGIEVEDPDATQALIEAHGGTVLSAPGEGALKFRSPDGTVAEIAKPGRYKKKERNAVARIVHLAIKVMDLEAATRFYANVFGFTEVRTGRSREHISRHMTDGNFDLALMLYDDEASEEARLAGPGPRIHHWGIEVDDRAGFAQKIAGAGGTIWSKPGAGTVKFRSPDGTLAEVVLTGRYETMKKHA